METLKLVHLSDPHFSHITLSPSQFINKRWIGNMNLLFFRRHAYQTEHLPHLPELLNSLKVDQVCITGDFSSLSLDSEFSAGKKFVDSFSQPVHLIPGNHDCYTKHTEKTRRFYDFFPSEDLRNKRVEKKALGKGWWWVGLDCAIATPPFYALGRFSEEMEEELDTILNEIPQNERVVLGNHFPLYPTNRSMHDLQRAHELQSLLKRHSKVKLYLHGHDHRYYIKDKRAEGLPLVFNSGSAAHRPDGTFLLFELHEKECLVDRLLFRKGKKGFSWVIDWQKHFTYRL
jgi:3',5'-cyclic AMP phosphodiesterase CpdA